MKTFKRKICRMQIFFSLCRQTRPSSDVWTLMCRSELSRQNTRVHICRFTRMINTESNSFFLSKACLRCDQIWMLCSLAQGYQYINCTSSQAATQPLTDFSHTTEANINKWDLWIFILQPIGISVRQKRYSGSKKPHKYLNVHGHRLLYIQWGRGREWYNFTSVVNLFF